MRVYITGGGGFIGSHLADQLLARGDQVFIIDDFSTGRRGNLTPNGNLTVVENTILDGPLVTSSIVEFAPDIIVHAAASYNDPENWQTDAAVNVQGTVNVLKAAVGAGTGRLIYLQTSLCYGSEPEQQPIPLDHRLSPANSYAISKTAAEQYIAMSGLDFVSFRLANAYGPRNFTGPLPAFFKNLTSGKACHIADTRRDFIFIDDMIRCLILAVDGVGKGFYHLSTGSDYAIKELFDETLAVLRIELDTEVEVRPRLPEDVYSILLDASKTKQDFGWEASTPLSEGVRKTVNWYREHGVQKTYSHLKQPALSGQAKA